ncbi:MAG: ABC transporter ATP-binding protein [Halobacteriales archaeon SW_8_66_22]|nr:MAG: ABC transporter ATP-binding protein [Halobacteriales archaeon SW_8_66_22]
MITVRDLVHEFDGERVLDGVSLTIADGEWVVLAGPNGSGKTTLVRHFNALLEPDAGEVQIGGVPAAENPVRARTSVGMVFQSPRDQFVAATVGADVAFGPENLGLDHDEIDRRVAEALGAVNMTDREEERIDELSGGEQARVAIAGALAMEPDHLDVLDRADRVVGLDSGTVAFDLPPDDARERLAEIDVRVPGPGAG